MLLQSTFDSKKKKSYDKGTCQENFEGRDVGAEGFLIEFNVEIGVFICEYI